MEIDKKSLKKMFPNLSEELNDKEGSISMDSVNEERATQEKKADVFRNFEPTAEDYIRRCDTHLQAEEIICYLEQRGELSAEKAKKMRKQLAKEGLRSFGSKKESNYYFKEGGLL